MAMTDLTGGAFSLHFSPRELACHHCGVNGAKQELVDALEALRSLLNAPIKINDAYRCAIHNAEVGGVPNSEHTQGIAADISVHGLSAAQIEAAARKIEYFRGIGRNDKLNYVHVDTRSKEAQWCYADNGQQCTYYPPTIGA